MHKRTCLDLFPWYHIENLLPDDLSLPLPIYTILLLYGYDFYPNTKQYKHPNPKQYKTKFPLPLSETYFLAFHLEIFLLMKKDLLFYTMFIWLLDDTNQKPNHSLVCYYRERYLFLKANLPPKHLMNLVIIRYLQRRGHYVQNVPHLYVLCTSQQFSTDFL